MKKLPVGIQNFRKIIEGYYVYVDKTKYVYDLLNHVSYYFLSRPRQFGKSLLLDTIAEAFSGDKELFNGLYIYDSDYTFEKHPVIRLDMSNIARDTPEILRSALCNALREHIHAEKLGISSDLPSDLFINLIMGLHKKYGKRVVVLIDEYDKPMLDQLSNIEVAEANRDVLSGFYGVLKSMDPYLRLTFFTGVSKFTKTSVFSGLNNLLDITMTEKYASICGIEVDNLGVYFNEHIKELAHEKRFARYSNLHNAILAWYDGYSWDGETRVINPFSLLCFFEQRRFESFWYSSGTPSFLIKLLKEKPESFLLLDNFEIRERVLDSFDIRRMEAEPLLFQTGYLTVDEVRYLGDTASYLLKIPNQEVKEAFYLNIVAEFTEKGESHAETAFRRIKGALESGDLELMLDILRSLFASIPYQLHIKHEHYYHSILYALISVLGFNISVEVSVSGGRLDAVLELDDKVYVMEFKYADCPPDAITEEKRKQFDKALDEGAKQIVDKGYSKKFEDGSKEIVKAVFAFLGRDEIEMRIL